MAEQSDNVPIPASFTPPKHIPKSLREMVNNARQDFKDPKKNHGIADYQCLEEYNLQLPTYGGLQLESLVTQTVEKKKKEVMSGNHPYEKPVIVDAGYGVGNFLLDSRERWGEDVDLIGYGSKTPALREEHHFYYGNDITFPTYPQLQASHVRLVDGDITEINKVLGNNVADFLTCQMVMTFVKYPDWEIIRKFYRVLKPGGIALINNCGLNRSLDVKKLKDFLESKGIEFETDSSGNGFAIKKTIPNIPPLPEGVVLIDQNNNKLNFVEYKSGK